MATARNKLSGPAAWCGFMASLPSGGECPCGTGDLVLAAGGQLADDADEVGVLEARDEERPAVGALLVRPDLPPLAVAEGPAARPRQGVDIQLALRGQEP